MNASLRSMKTGRSLFKIICAVVSFFVFAQKGMSQILWSSTGGSAWLTGTNWTGNAVPTSTQNAQFGLNPTGSSGVGINYNNATNNGTQNQAVGGIEQTSVRTSGALVIGNSSTTAGKNGILTLNGATINSVNNVILRNASSQNVTIQNTQGSGNLTMGVALGNTTNNLIYLDGTGNIIVSSIISSVSGSTPLTTAGISTSGTVSFTSTANTFSGTISLLGPETVFSADGSFGNTSNGIIIDGGRMTTAAPGFTISSTRSIQLGSTAGTSISTKGTNTTIYNGVIANKAGATGAWAKQGGGILQLGGASTYSGATAINNGVLQLTTGNDRLPTGTVLSLGQSASANIGTFDLNGFNQTVAGLNSVTGTNATASKNTITSTGGAATLTIGGSGTYSYGDGSAANSGIITGAISVVKNGSGTQTFGDANTYTGTTTVNGGSLIIPKTGYTATITSGTITVAFSSTPSAGTYVILPGALNGSQTFTATGLSANQTASFNFSNSTVTITNVPYLTSSITTITGLTYVQGSGPSAASSSFNITGGNLTPSSGNITVTPSSNIEVFDGSAWQSSSFTIAYSSSAISTSTVYQVRLKAGLSPATYNSESVTIAGGTATTSLSVSGSVTSAPSPILNISGTQDHGAVCVGTPASTIQYTITNTGTGNASGVSVSSNNAQFVVSNLSSTSISASGGTATFNVTFTPTSSGAQSATITVSSTSSGSNSPTYSLTGTGLVVTTQAVTTSAATSIVNTTATLNGNLTTLGTCPPTSEKGFVYAPTSTNSNPQVGGTGVTQMSVAGVATGTYNLGVTGLSANTNYSYTAYAFNGTNYTYGTVSTFTTLNAASKLAFGTQPPSTGAAGSNLATFTVQALRADNSVDVEFTGNITIAKASGSGTLSGTLTVAAVAGVATFSAAQFDIPDTYTITASSGSLATVTSGNIVVSNIILWSSTSGSAWLTATNWTGNAIPNSTQVAQFGTNPTSGTTGVGINMGNATNNGTANEIVGAVEVSSVRTKALIIGNSSSSVSGILTLNGTVVNSVSNTVLRNNSAQSFTIQNAQGGATQTLGVVLANTTNNIINLDGTGSITISSNISSLSGSTPLNISGVSTSGTVALTSASNSFTGTITLNGPETVFSSDGSFGNTANAILIDGGRMTTAAPGFTINSSRSIEVSDAAGTSISVKSGGSVSTFSGIISDKPGTTGSWAKQGGGTLQLGGVNTYSGVTSINNGILQLITGNDRLPSGTVVNIGQSASSNIGTLDLNGNNQTIAGLNSVSGTNASASQNTVTSTSGAATLTISGSGNYSYGDGSTTNSGIITGAISLVKNGSGTQTFGDANAYTGTTTVSGGSLIINKTGYTATITSSNILVAFSPSPSLGSYPILPGALNGSQTFSATGLDASQSATFNASTGIVIIGTNTYTLTYTAGSNGTISGSSPQTVNYGGSGTAVTAVANTGYHFVQWSDGVLTETRTDANVTANVSVTATFAINTYTLTYTAGSNGTISGSSPQTVNYGGSGTAVTAVANTGYHFVQWSDGVLTATRTDANVTANVSVTATFAINTYTITSSAGSNGSISPNGVVNVNYGESQGYTITANSGYAVSDVLVDGSSVGAVSSYSFNNVSANHTITASFYASTPVITSSTTGSSTYGAGGTYTITASNTPTGYNATLNPSGALPSGFSVNTTTGVITVSATAQAGSYSLLVSASNAASTGTQVVTYTVNQAALTITANSGVKCNGATYSFAGTEFTQSGLVNGDAVSGVTLTSAGASAGAASNTYPIVISAATGTGLSNYAISYVNGTLTVETLAFTYTLTNPDCNGNLGTITGAATNGYSPFSYKLNTGSVYDPNGTFGSTATFGGLAAGTYTYAVQDAYGCLAVHTGIPLAALTKTAIVVNGGNTAVCYGGGVTMSTTATTGTAPYTYSLDGGAFVSSANRYFYATAGSHTITVKDASSPACTYTTDAVVITQPTAALTQTTAVTNANCNVPTGSLTITGAGGYGGYTYSLNAGTFQGSGTFAGLAPGTYTVAVKDSHGCTVTGSATITQSVLTTSAITGSTTVCYGTTTTISTTPSGGTAPYQYSLDGGAYVPSSQRYFGVVGAGTHTISVKDAVGCVVPAGSITISQPSAPLSFTTAVTNGNCTTGNLGTITITAAGGYSGSYSYSVDGGNTFQPSNVFSGLAANTYSIVVKDQNGCAVNGTAVVKGSTLTAAAVSAGSTQLCFGGTTTISTTGSGGTAPYTYSLDGGTYVASGSRFFSVSAGTHTITVKDNLGCTVNAGSVTVNQADAVTVSTTIGGTGCSGNGSITVSASGGYSNYSYSDGGAYQTPNVFSGLPYGSYSVTAKDQNGCTSAASVVKLLALTSSAIQGTTTVCAGGFTTINTVPSGGKPPYTYSLDGGAYVTSANRYFYVGIGTHTITVKDNAGCTFTPAAVNITQGSCKETAPVTQTKQTVPSGMFKVNVYPNPSVSAFTVQLQSSDRSDVEFVVMNMLGEKVYEGKGSVDQTFKFGANFVSGVYLMEIRQGKQFHTVKLVKGN